MMRRDALVGGALAAVVVVFGAGCDGSPVAPSGPVGPAEVTVTAAPLTAPLGGLVTFDFWLSRPLDRAVELWRTTTGPNGREGIGPINFPTGSTRTVQSTGYLREVDVGDWELRIDRLPEGVVLGNPSSVRWSVVP